MRPPGRDDTRAPRRGRDNGALSAAALTWIAIGMACLVTVAGLAWAGVFSSDDSPGDFHGTVVDWNSGDPLAGVVVTPTDETGAPISSLTAVTAADGSYAITGLTSDEYGLFVDGSAVAHSSGYVALASGPHGHQVVDSWGAAATYAPGVIGDIALLPVETPTTTAPETTVPTTPATTASTSTTLAPTTTVNQPPSVGTLVATPNVVRPFEACGTNSTVLSVRVTDDTGVASVKVEWSYLAMGTITPSITLAGTVSLARVGASNTWRGTLTVSIQPFSPPATQFIELKVVATDTAHMVWRRYFHQSLSITVC